MPAGSVQTRLIAGDTIETTYVGRITPPMADEVRRDIERLMHTGPLGAATPITKWLVDTTSATTFEAAPRESTLGVIDTFRTSGGKTIATVVPSASIRMFVAAFVFALGLPLKGFATRDQALRFLERDPS